MSARVVECHGAIYHFDDQDRLHREDGPAVASKINGYEEWRTHGVVQEDRITPEQLAIREDIRKRYSRMAKAED